MGMTTGREAAFSLLSKIEKDKSYSNLILAGQSDKTDMTRQEMVFAHCIVKTVLERKISIDYNLSLYLTQPLKKLKPQVLTILRMGACQILFMDKIPVSAAINESVNLTKKHGCAFASGLVNAVLRKVGSSGFIFPDEKDRLKYLSIKYSFPEFICKEYIDYYGVETAEKIMASSIGAGKIYVRKNNTKCDQLGTDAEKCDVIPNCYILHDSDIGSSEDYKNGLFHVQDLSSQLCCNILNPEKGETVIDICASPGGKTSTIAEIMENDGKVISCDIYEHKLKLIEDNVKRLGLSIVETKLRDGTDKESALPMADRILCDVPCSGFGVVGKKPEIKYKNKEDISSLPSIQYSILENSCKYVKKGGRIVYSTCTLLHEENAEICKKFLGLHSEFVPVHIDDSIDGFRDGETLTVLPYIYGCDGFFIAAFERTV